MIIIKKLFVMARILHIWFLTKTVLLVRVVLAFFQVMPTYNNPSGTKAYIMNMYTKPEYRRNGIAYKTLDMLIKDIKGKGISAISLEATEMGIPNLSLGRW